MAGIDQEAFDRYFATEPGVVNPDKVISPPQQDAKHANAYTYQQQIPGTTVQTTEDIPVADIERYIAEGNIDDIDQLGELLRQLLNAAWGTNWGVISPELVEGEDPENIPMPQITYDTNHREVAENKGIKPTLTDTIIEVVNGQRTGDAFNVYRQWFDCIIEFNFWGRNSLEARKLMNRFEALMGAYSGHLKKKGVSEIIFLKEVPAKQSIKFVDGLPMRSLMYYVRLERIQTIRTSTLRNIDMRFELENEEFTTGQNNPDDINTTVNGITYNF